MRLIDKLIKKITGFTPDEILKLDKEKQFFENELKKVPLCQKYKLAIMGKKGFCIKNTIFEEKDINNSNKKIPLINPFSTCITLLGDAGSGKSLLTSKILSNSKKILYFGCINEDYYKQNPQRNFRIKLNEKDDVLFEQNNTTYHSHQINFYKEDKDDIASIELPFIECIDKYIEPFYSIFETFIFNAIKNGYSIVFDEKYFYFEASMKTNKFSELITFAYDRLKLEIEQLKLEAITNNAKIIISVHNHLFKNTLFNNIECSYYIDELILVDSFNCNRTHSFQELEERYSFFMGDYFKYHLIQNYTKVGDYIHFEKLKFEK